MFFRFACCALFAATVALTLPVQAAMAAPRKLKPQLVKIEHVERNIEGWTVHLDKRLTLPEHKETADLGLRILANKLFEITQVVPARPLAEMRKVAIYVDLEHALGSLQYHPDAGWLKSNGYDPAMAKAVHIPGLKRLIGIQRRNRQPWVMLHELAHAYHDQVLGFDHEEIRRAYDHLKASKKLQSVLIIDGGNTGHYAQTNHKEYFAEMTESYFAVNDFYPFVRAELKQFSPETYKMLDKIWRK